MLSVWAAWSRVSVASGFLGALFELILFSLAVRSASNATGAMSNGFLLFFHERPPPPGLFSTRESSSLIIVASQISSVTETTGEFLELPDDNDEDSPVPSTTKEVSSSRFASLGSSVRNTVMTTAHPPETAPISQKLIQRRDTEADTFTDDIIAHRPPTTANKTTVFYLLFNSSLSSQSQWFFTIIIFSNHSFSPPTILIHVSLGLHSLVKRYEFVKRYECRRKAARLFELTAMTARRWRCTGKKNDLYSNNRPSRQLRLTLFRLMVESRVPRANFSHRHNDREPTESFQCRSEWAKTGSRRGHSRSSDNTVLR